MLKLMENDYGFHWRMLQDAKAYGDENMQSHHEGACNVILRYYALILDCTVIEARERMQKRVRGVTC
jgi:hypothetical protein